MNRSFSKIRHIQEANLRLEKRLISERKQLNEDVLSDLNLKVDKSIIDPKVKKVIQNILKCMAMQPLKSIDYLRGVTLAVLGIFGEPEGSSSEDWENFEGDVEELKQKLKKLFSPCQLVTVDEVNSLVNNEEFRKFFMDLKKEMFWFN